MELQVNRWGNSLAVRLPQELVRELHATEGSTIEAQAVSPGHLKLAGAPEFDRKAFLQKLKKLRAAMPLSDPVVEQMRREARY